LLLHLYNISFPGVEKRVSLAYAREKIKARRKSALKKNSLHEMSENTCEPLKYIEFWDEENNSIDDEDLNEDIYSDGDDLSEKSKDSCDVYSDEQGFKFTVVSVKDETR